MTDLARRLVLLVLATLLALVGAELALRLLAPIPYSMRLEWEPDGHLGARLVPRRVYRLADGGRVTVNRLGFRGAERLRWQKPAGTFRIAALGGSATFCYQTDDAAIWTFRLQQKLREHYGSAIEVVNAGMPGLSVFESKIHYLYRVRELEPDAVLVYHGWNDMKRFRALEGGSHLVRKSVYRGDPLRGFLRRFQLAWRIRALVQGRPPGAPPPRAEDTVAGHGFQGERIPDGGRAHAWERSNYDDLGLLVGADDALPIFVAQASLVSEEALRDPEARARIYVEYQDLSYAEVLRQTLAIRAIVRDAAAAHDAVFVDAYAAVPHTLEHFHDHVHLTERGNEAVAEALRRELVADPRFDRRARAASGAGRPRPAQE